MAAVKGWNYFTFKSEQQQGGNTMKAIPGIATALLAIATGTVATAQNDTHYGMDSLAEGNWEQMVSLEACMNGGVSASGLYPSQFTENMSFSTRGTMAKIPSE
jgi:hypothetical protein